MSGERLGLIPLRPQKSWHEHFPSTRVVATTVEAEILLKGGSMRRSRLTGFVTSLLLAAGLGLTGAGHATAATGGYVALGDSYSSGVGAGSYISSSGSCDRSTKAYPYLWNAAHSPSSFAFNACSGATTDDVMAGQLGSLNSATSLVSITIGGNDAGFSDVMTTCVIQSDSACI